MEAGALREPTEGLRLAPRRLLPDRRLARLAAAGDKRAFEGIFRRYHQEIYRYCRALLGNAEDAHDALQNTMAAALRALPGEKRDIPLRPWLYRVAHNEAISIARRRPSTSPLRDDDGPAIPGPADSLDGQESLRELVSDLHALPDRQRGALVMRELSGLSYEQISKALSCSEGAARQCVYEAREAMRELQRGRGMACEEVRRILSERDGRRMRGTAIRAHMNNCDGCQDFHAAISRRQVQFAALAPPLPAAAASGMLASLLGESASGAGTVGAASAGAGGASAGAGGASGAGAVGAAGAGGAGAALGKVGALVAAAAIGAGAVSIGVGGIDLPGLGGDDSELDMRVVGPGAPSAEKHAAANDGKRDGSAADEKGKDGRRDGKADESGEAVVLAGGEGGDSGDGGSGDHPGPPAHADGLGPPPTAGSGTGFAGGYSGGTPGGSPPMSGAGASNSNAGSGLPPSHAGGSGNPHH